MRRTVVLIALALAGCKRREAQDLELPPPPQELPPWFADPAAPARTIAGRVFVGQDPAPARVHLRIAVDPAAWAGMEITTGPDGMFDLGAWPPGEYLVMAEASGLTSRVVEVDTRTEAAAALQIFLHPCRPLAGQIRHGLRPIAGVELSLGGVLLATTAADGTYALCAFRDPSVKHSIHARSRHYTHARAFIEPHSVYVPRVSRSAVMAGVVRRRDGSPAAGIGVQANNAIETDHGFLPELAIVATTDAQGRFTIDGLSARGEWACFQYYDRGRLYACDEQALVKPSTDLRLVFDPAKVSRDEDALPPPTYVIAGRVTRGGAAVPDARILVHSYDAGDHETRTDRDGNFRVGQSAMQGTLDLHIGAPDGTHEKRSLPAGASIEGLQIAL